MKKRLIRRDNRWDQIWFPNQSVTIVYQPKAQIRKHGKSFLNILRFLKEILILCLNTMLCFFVSFHYNKQLKNGTTVSHESMQTWVSIVVDQLEFFSAKCETVIIYFLPLVWSTYTGRWLRHWESTRPLHMRIIQCPSVKVKKEKKWTLTFWELVKNIQFWVVQKRRH